MASPVLYVITPVLRHYYLGEVAKSLRSASEHFDVRWLPILGRSLRERGTVKRNTALDFIENTGIPGWIYNLDDDNLLHPSLPEPLYDAIHRLVSSQVFLIPQINSDGSLRLPNPSIARGNVDTACCVVSTEAARGVRWSNNVHYPDYDWISSICNRGFPAQVIPDALCYYNRCRYRNL